MFLQSVRSYQIIEPYTWIIRFLSSLQVRVGVWPVLCLHELACQFLTHTLSELEVNGENVLS